MKCQLYLKRGIIKEKLQEKLEIKEIRAKIASLGKCVEIVDDVMAFHNPAFHNSVFFYNSHFIGANFGNRTFCNTIFRNHTILSESLGG